jgi:hypothetical protein
MLLTKVIVSDLHDVVDFGLDEVEEGRDASFGRLLHLDGTTADGANRLAHEVDVNLGRVPKEEQLKYHTLNYLTHYNGIMLY